MKKLSVAQSRTLEKLIKVWKYSWVSPYELRERMSTLDSLVKSKLVETRGAGSLGSFASPRTTIEYRAIKK